MARMTVRVFSTSSSLAPGCGFWRNLCLTSLFRYSCPGCARRVGRQVEQLDLLAMALDPALDLPGVMHLQVVDNEELHERLFEHLKRSPKLFMDETQAPVLDPGRKGTKSGYLWAIARDDRPWPVPIRRRSPISTRERSIRPIALSRTNALFAGSDQGGVHWGVIASLIETRKLNAVDPHTYLATTLTRLVNRHPRQQIAQLMPWAYANQVA